TCLMFASLRPRRGDPERALYVFFFQAEDGIRDGHVTGVQTCALPISRAFAMLTRATPRTSVSRRLSTCTRRGARTARTSGRWSRSEERRVGKECISGAAPER